MVVISRQTKQYRINTKSFTNYVTSDITCLHRISPLRYVLVMLRGSSLFATPEAAEDAQEAGLFW